MNITSSAFGNNTSIPSIYTCNGENINPPLNFSDIPESTKSLALIVDDPDAPGGDWVHWVVFNIDPAINFVAENSIPKDGIEGATSFGNTGYGGPCPPSGTHRYFFKLYSLNKTLSINGVGDKDSILKAMEGSILAQAELIGLYNQH